MVKGGKEIGTNGTFGIGGSSKQISSYTGGGGGGYYGGASSNDGQNSVSSGSGGSSYISGMLGCNSVDENGNHTNSRFHFSGYKFRNCVTYSGYNDGDGYALITLIETCTHQKYFLNFFNFKIYVFIFLMKR